MVQSIMNNPLIFLLLVALVLCLGAVVIHQYVNQRDRTNAPDNDNIYKVRFKEAYKANKELQHAKDKVEAPYKKLVIEYNQAEDKYSSACVEIGKLKVKIDDLARENNELKKLLGKDSTTETIENRKQNELSLENQQKHSDSNNDLDSSAKDSKEVQSKQGQLGETNKEKVTSSKDDIKYASFPRSAGSSVYFSDLTENNVEDSYFELNISKSTGKATFKPLDFLKIRNFDPAMAAIRTEGVKPNVATAVSGITPGKAHLDGKEWIVDSPAIIKLS